MYYKNVAICTVRICIIQVAYIASLEFKKASDFFIECGLTIICTLCCNALTKGVWGIPSKKVGNILD